MTSEKKLIEKLLNSPQNLRYSEIERLFKKDKYVIREGKGSHKVIYNILSKDYEVIPLHNNDCKLKYKKRLRELYFNNK